MSQRKRNLPVKKTIQKKLNPTEDEWKHLDIIKKEIPYVDIRPFSHNIINLELNLLGNVYDDDKMNELIILFGLDKMGWNCV